MEATQPENPKHLPRYAVAAAMALITVLRMWLVQGQAFMAIGNAAYDDQLFVKLAWNIAQTGWLGPYNMWTLYKGPMYPIWIALVYRAGIPLAIAQHLLYIGACLLFVRAIRPKLGNSWGSFLVYSWLLFEPSMLSVPRTIRMWLYTPAVLVIVACWLALGLRTDCRKRSFAGWCVGLGVAWTVMWFTREEGVWLVPSLVLVLLFLAWRIWRHAADRWSRLAMLTVPIWIWLCVAVTIAGLNYRHYGVFICNEATGGAWRVAFTALHRVKPHRHYRFIPLPRETREKIYEVSPAFAELRPILEGERGQAWAHAGGRLGRRPDGTQDMGGGWFHVAVREAVAELGYCKDARTSVEYYNRLTDEVNRACDSGVLPCREITGKYNHLLRGKNRKHIPKAVARVVRHTLTLPNLHLQGLSSGPEEELDLTRRVTRSGLARRAELGEFILDRPDDTWRVRVIRLIVTLYGAYLPWLTLTSILIWMAMPFYRRRIDFVWILCTALLGAAAARTLLLGCMEAAVFRAILYRYLSPIHSVLLPFIALSLYDLADFVRNRKQRAAEST